MTDLYAVFGNPIAHSKSPLVHSEFAKQTDQDLHYIKTLADMDSFESIVMQFKNQGGKGINITLPFKERAYLMADELSPRAIQAKAANTFLFRSDGTIYADSTDGVGFIHDLCVNHHYEIKDKKVLLLGAGGSARALLGPLLSQQPQNITVANRTFEKAKILVEEFKIKTKLNAADLNQLSKTSYDLIVNTTSAGMTGDSLELPQHLIHKNTWCYDVMYSDQVTPFLKWAQKNGAVWSFDGIGLLVEQAAESFYLWRGIRPNTKEVIDLLNQSRAMS